MAHDAEFERAERAAFRLLAYRARGIEELRGRLRKKGFSAPATDAVIDGLVRQGFLDDDGFAFEWARSHAVHRLWSDVKLAAGLREKGVSRDMTVRAISRVRRDFTEREAVSRIAAKRARNEAARGPQENDTVKRMVRNLLARGFPPSIVYETLRDIREDDIDNGE
jgi:regulatory protein